MMYPFIQLEDNTEIVHSEILNDGQIKVYIEKPIDGGFHSATCFLPSYEWCGIIGFTQFDIENYQEIIESTVHLIFRFAHDGGLENAAGF
ncbi:MAG: hypothetical protein FWC95_00370 [Defluviitaleaceae bacterium]|nr:hypothetical protein [Defluviitaleaceae bacterium]